MRDRIYMLFIIFFSFVYLASCEEVDPDQIEENFYLKNDGVEMPVFVRGSVNATKILVIVHGGPGGTSLNHYYQIPEFTSRMEEDYLLIYWEQRGSGMSSGKLNSNDFTLEKMSDDLDQLLHVLEYKYGEEKELFLLGQSFGSLLTAKFISSEAVDDHNIAGWMTIGAIYSFTNYAEVLHSHIKQFLDQRTDEEWESLKEKMSSLDYSESSLKNISDWNELGDEMQIKVAELGYANQRQVTEMKGLISTSYYNLFTVFFNGENANKKIFKEIYDVSLKEDLKEAKTPALWMCGEYDYLTPRTYGDSLLAFYGHPDKQHVVFPRGTHNVIATNLEKTIEVMTEFMESH